MGWAGQGMLRFRPPAARSKTHPKLVGRLCLGRAGRQELDDLQPEHLELQKCDVSIQGALRKLSGRERKGDGGAVVQPLLTFFSPSSWTMIS